MPENQGDHSRLSRKQIFIAFAGLFVLCVFLLVSVWLVIDSGKRYKLPVRQPQSTTDRTNVAAGDTPTDTPTPTPTCTITPIPLSCNATNCRLYNINPIISPSSATFNYSLDGNLSGGGAAEYRVYVQRGTDSTSEQALVGTNQSIALNSAQSSSWILGCGLFTPGNPYFVSCGSETYPPANSTPTATP